MFASWMLSSGKLILDRMCPRIASSRSDAEKYKREDRVPYTVLIDDLPGTTHQVYGGLADPSYLIDADGRVAFYNLWTHAPTLHMAIEELVARGERGVVRGGKDSVPHLLATMTNGWLGLRRGLPQSFLELEAAAPGMASGSWLGYQVRGLLAPVALRATPLPNSAKAALLAGGVLLLAAALRGRRKHEKGGGWENS